jgi:hypothetical protein
MGGCLWRRVAGRNVSVMNGSREQGIHQLFAIKLRAGNLTEEPCWKSAVEAYNSLLLDHVGHEGKERHTFMISRKCCQIHAGSDVSVLKKRDDVHFMNPDYQKQLL